MIYHTQHTAAAPAAKSHQSCPTLCSTIDGSPPGSSVHGIFQARVLEWGATAFSIPYGSVPFSSVTQSCPTLCDPMNAAFRVSLPITNSRSLLKLMSIESVKPSSHLILCRPLLLLPSIFPNIRVFSSESTLRMTWPKYWSFSFNISPSNEHPGLISFRMDWVDLLAVQGTFKSPTVQKHQFFSTQLSL